MHGGVVYADSAAGDVVVGRQCSSVPYNAACVFAWRALSVRRSWISQGSAKPLPAREKNNTDRYAVGANREIAKGNIFSLASV